MRFSSGATAGVAAVSPLVAPLEGWDEPERGLEALSGDDLPVMLRSFPGGRRVPEHGRWSILATSPFARVDWRMTQGADPFERLAREVEVFRCASATGLPFSGGAIGYIGYDAGRRVERIDPAGRGRPPLERVVPDVLFGLYSWAVLWDHRRRRRWVVSTGFPESGRLRLRKARDDARAVSMRLSRFSVATPSERHEGASPVPAPVVGSSLSRSAYLDMVRRARRGIARGDYYQVNLSQRLLFAAPRCPRALFEAIGRLSAAPFSGYMGAGPFTIVSASPERFLSLRGRTAESRPIKGTAPRGPDPDEDRRRARELLASSKDRAENVMIVDLVRNDLGRVCRPGSVEIAGLCRLETYASVHHLVSTVRGVLDDDRGRIDLIRALFPAGSMTGAPKPRAMQEIEDLEPHRRGVYAGSMGYLSFCGDLDLNIMIRTVIVTGRSAWLQVGGGIVADSRPSSEYRESLDKALSVRRALAWAGASSRETGDPGRDVAGIRDASPMTPRGKRTVRHQSARRN